MSVPFPFLVGAARSGTTLLRAMLDSHPDLAVTPESHFLVELLELGDSATDAQRVDVLRRHEDSRWPLRTPLGSSLSRGAPWPAHDDAPTAARQLYASYAAARDKPRWGDKTPGHVMSITALATWFPEAVFIHLVRDGRDVAASLAAASFGPRRILDAARTWQGWVSEARAAGRPLGERYLEVTYERLVDDPEATLREVGSTIDLRFDPSMLDFAARAEQVLADVPNLEDHPNLAADLERRRSWRRDLSEPLVAAIEHDIGVTLDQFGYQPSGAAFGVRARGRRAAHRIRRVAGAARSGLRPQP